MVVFIFINFLCMQGDSYGTLGTDVSCLGPSDSSNLGTVKLWPPPTGSLGTTVDSEPHTPPILPQSSTTPA